MAKINSFQFYQDPGHGWVRVPVKLLKELGIVAKISPYSYLKGEYAYLEEDCDYGAWKQAMNAANKAFTLIEKYTNNSSPIRNYLAFTEESFKMIEAVKVGAVFYGYNSTVGKYVVPITITAIKDGKVHAVNNLGVSYSPMAVHAFLNRVKLDADH